MQMYKKEITIYGEQEVVLGVHNYFNDLRNTQLELGELYINDRDAKYTPNHFEMIANTSAAGQFLDQELNNIGKYFEFESAYVLIDVENDRYLLCDPNHYFYDDQYALILPESNIESFGTREEALISFVAGLQSVINAGVERYIKEIYTTIN